MIANRKSIYYLRLFLDLALLNIAFIISAIAAQSFSTMIERNYMFILLAILNFLWYFVTNVVNFYDDFRTSFYSFRFVNILKIIAVQALISVLFIFFAKEDLFTRNFIIYYSVLLFLFVSIRIIIVRKFLSGVGTRRRNIWNLLIIGSGEIGQGFYNMISEHKEFGYNMIGFVDDSDLESESVLGKIESLGKVIKENQVDEVVVALPIYASDQLDNIMEICNREAVRVNIIPDYFRFISKKFQVNMLGDFPVIRVRSEPLAEAHWRFIKRTFDIIFSIIALIFIISWLYPLIFIINAISSKGPTIFKQDRIGINNKIFKCYKFRTMHVSRVEEKYKPLTDNDPRVTGFGKYLRKTNLDEIPQFLNVLKGEMSVVGPRPHPLPFNAVYEKMVAEIKIRSWVKPGLTGWAQVHGLRGDVADYEENTIRTRKRIEYDIWYIENWSFWLDIQIILMTIWQMIRGNTSGL